MMGRLPKTADPFAVRAAKPVLEWTVRNARVLAFSLVAAIQSSTAISAAADEWPPRDPDQPETTIAFTNDWALTLREAKTFRQLQERMGSAGKIVESKPSAATPNVVFEWISTASGERVGEARATLYPTGDFGVVVRRANSSQDIVMNNFNAFVCRDCSPAVDACGRRPSWVPHDVHWDSWDCHSTMTGPQSTEGDAR